eukprot:6181524-Pleurochrysis_carterae.AAC.2
MWTESKDWNPSAILELTHRAHSARATLQGFDAIPTPSLPVMARSSLISLPFRHSPTTSRHSPRNASNHCPLSLPLSLARAEPRVHAVASSVCGLAICALHATSSNVCNLVAHMQRFRHLRKQ